jgi:hypothetical protein
MGISVKKGSNFHRKSTRITFNIRSSSVTVGNSLINTPTCRQLGKLIQYALVAQWIEHRIPNPGAAGSIPAGGTNKIKP